MRIPFDPKVTRVGLTVALVSGLSFIASLMTGALHTASPIHHIFGHYMTWTLSGLSLLTVGGAIVAGLGESVTKPAVAPIVFNAPKEWVPRPPPPPLIDRIFTDHVAKTETEPLPPKKKEEATMEQSIPPFLKQAKVAALDRIIASATPPTLNSEAELAAAYAYSLVLADLQELRTIISK